MHEKCHGSRFLLTNSTTWSERNETKLRFHFLPFFSAMQNNRSKIRSEPSRPAEFTQEFIFVSFFDFPASLSVKKIIWFHKRKQQQSKRRRWRRGTWSDGIETSIMNLIDYNDFKTSCYYIESYSSLLSELTWYEDNKNSIFSLNFSLDRLEFTPRNLLCLFSKMTFHILISPLPSTLSCPDTRHNFQVQFEIVINRLLMMKLIFYFDMLMSTRHKQQQQPKSCES